ncbi:hypothetical protein [Paenibacillus sp. HB172176]|uniref:hypothetical protein n=1 Tax=Paenibacillus sp. HB172176 TaxID=2493690 RepID=UPI00143A131A|nr:hypothetical protein [Paenibacillus sp. HB172176]
MLSYDAGFPLLYAIALALCARVLLRRAFPDSSKAAKLGMIPLFAGLFDYIENLLILLLLHHYPAHMSWLAETAGFFTLAKWTMTLVSAALLITSILRIWAESRNRSFTN